MPPKNNPYMLADNQELWEIIFNNGDDYEEHDKSPIAYFKTEIEAKEFCDAYVSRCNAHDFICNQLGIHNRYVSGYVSYNKWIAPIPYKTVQDALKEHCDISTTIENKLVEWAKKDVVCLKTRLEKDFKQYDINNQWITTYKNLRNINRSSNRAILEEQYFKLDDGSLYYVGVIDGELYAYYSFHVSSDLKCTMLGCEFDSAEDAIQAANRHMGLCNE